MNKLKSSEFKKFSFKKFLLWFVLITAITQIGRFLGREHGTKIGTEEVSQNFKSTFYKSYLEDCIKRGSSESYCKCYGNELITRNTVEQLQKDTKMLEDLGFNPANSEDMTVERAQELIENNPEFLEYALKLREIEQYCKSNTR